MNAASTNRDRVRFPYLSVPAMRNLQQIGVSSLGTHQIRTGELLTSTRDRGIVLALMSALEHSHAPLVLPRLGWETVDSAREHFHGFVSRFSAGRVVKNAEDQLVLAEILETAAGDVPRFAMVAASFKNTNPHFN